MSGPSNKAPQGDVLSSTTGVGTLTEEDIFRMKDLGRGATSVGTSENAEQSIISLADSASNFDEHVGDEFDEVEEAPENISDPESRVFNGWMFERRRQDSYEPNSETVTVLRFPVDAGLSIPECPTGDDPSEWKKAFEDAVVYLVGTAHFSKESQEDVMTAIRARQPDMVMVELCPSRISILSMDEATLLKEASELNTEKIMTIIKQTGTVQGLLHVMLLSMSAHITRQLLMAPGGEFRAAHRAALETNLCRLVLGDRPIQVTLQRALGSLTCWQKVKFLWHVSCSHFSSITPEEVERCKQRDMLEELLAEMAGDFPQLSKIMVDERDQYMTNALHNILVRNTAEKRLAWNGKDVPWQPLNVVAVVGIGHMPGIVAHWDNKIDIAPLIKIPPPSKIATAVRLTFKMAFYGAIGYALYRGGARVARRLAQ